SVATDALPSQCEAAGESSYSSSDAKALDRRAVELVALDNTCGSMIEITWQYEPHSYFESDFTADVHSGSIALAGGVATFIAESDSADPKLLVEDASAELKALLDARAILT